jgi:hypothetical protein
MHYYQIVVKINLQDLVTEINEMIKKGWKPSGGIAIDGNGLFYQAMVS